MRRALATLAAAAVLASCGGPRRSAQPPNPPPADLGESAVIVGHLAFPDGTVPKRFDVGAGAVGPLTFTDQTGDFRLVVERVRPDPTLVRISGAGFRRPDPCITPGPVKLSPGRVHDLGTIVVDRGRTIRGRVVGIDGRPAPGMQVLAGREVFWHSGLASSSGENLRARGLLEQIADVDDDGRYELSGFSDDPITVFALGDAGRMSPPRVAPPGDHGPIDLAIAESGILVGAVRRDGTPSPAAVTIRSGGLVMTVRTGAQGRYRVEDLPPGDYVVTAIDNHLGFNAFANAASSATVASGWATHADLDLTDTVRVAFEVALADAALLGWQGIVITRGPLMASRWSEVKLAPDYPALGATWIKWLAVGPDAMLRLNLAFGEYTACAAAGTGELALCEAPRDDSPVVCQSFTIVPAPEPQTVRLEVPAR